VQFTGIHLNFFDRIKVNIGTFSVNNGYQISSEKPCGIMEQKRMIETAYPARADLGDLCRHELSQMFTGKQALNVPLPLITYDASGCPKMFDTSKGVMLDCYV
jgi:hypothetical protein